ncbi:MAG: hypothetical protein WB497_14495, partial [Pseudolabrys sp.]
RPAHYQRPAEGPVRSNPMIHCDYPLFFAFATNGCRTALSGGSLRVKYGGSVTLGVPHTRN